MSKFVVVDEILEQLEAVKSGVVPGSVVQSVVSGVQNVPSNIVQQGEASGGGCYTTFPLSPIVKNCNLDQSYLNLEFDMNMTLSYDAPGADCVLPFWIGFRDTSAIFNQIQILIENSALKTSTYHREESVIAYNSLPETEIRGNNQYSSLEKIMLNKYSPMKRVVLNIKSADTKTDITLHFNVTVDINRLDPILSNLHFTTPHFGNLRLKVWIQRIQEAMFFCPDYNFCPFITAAGNTAANINAALSKPQQNQYWCFYPLSSYLNVKILGTVIPFYATSTNELKLLNNVMFAIDPTKPFMTFNGGVAEIVQKNFDIKEDEYQRLNDYFASTGSIIIPTQTFETQTFNNSTIAAGSNWISTQIGTIGGYNVNFISTWTHPQSQSTCFMKEFLKDIQLILDGRPVNSLPYKYVNDKCIVDCTQAIIDTDHEEINSDYIASLSCFNVSDNADYIDSKTTFPDYYGTGAVNKSIGTYALRNPNTFCLNFSTNLPDAFHSGACILENSNRNGVVRLNSSVNDSNAAYNTTLFPYIINHKSLSTISATDASVVGFTAFCDCCIVLTYDSVRGTCFDGQLSWSAPYV